MIDLTNSSRPIRPTASAPRPLAVIGASLFLLTLCAGQDARADQREAQKPDAPSSEPDRTAADAETSTGVQTVVVTGTRQTGKKAADSATPVDVISGASAQYGSDAIAGVINIILKSATRGGSLQTTLGQYYQGDGLTRDVAGNSGASLGDNGFLDLSAEYAGRDHTNHTGIDPRTWAYDNKILGDPATDRETLGFNAGYYVSDAIELYGFGSYAHRDSDAYETFRTGSTLPQLYPSGFSPRPKP